MPERVPTVYQVWFCPPHGGRAWRMLQQDGGMTHGKYEEERLANDMPPLASLESFRATPRPHRPDQSGPKSNHNPKREKLTNRGHVLKVRVVYRCAYRQIGAVERSIFCQYIGKISVLAQRAVYGGEVAFCASTKLRFVAQRSPYW